MFTDQEIQQLKDAGADYVGDWLAELNDPDDFDGTDEAIDIAKGILDEMTNIRAEIGADYVHEGMKERILKEEYGQAHPVWSSYYRHMKQTAKFCQFAAVTVLTRRARSGWTGPGVIMYSGILPDRFKQPAFDGVREAHEEAGEPNLRYEIIDLKWTEVDTTDEAVKIASKEAALGAIIKHKEEDDGKE